MKLNVTSATELVAVVNLRSVEAATYWSATQSAHPLLPPSALLHSKSPVDSTTVIRILLIESLSMSTKASAMSLEVKAV